MVPTLNLGGDSIFFFAPVHLAKAYSPRYAHRMVTLNSPSGSFFLARGFSHLSTNHRIIYFLLPLVYLVICWCLYDLHII